MRNWAHRLALVGVGLVCPALAAAHGGDAAISRVAAVDPDGSPWLLQLSEGLALRAESGWRFLCPAGLAASTVIDALSADGQTTWVATLRGLFRVTRDGALEAAQGQCGDTPSKLVAHRGEMHLLARDSARAQVIVCALEDAGPREIYASDDAVDDVVSDGSQLWIARVTEAGFELEGLESGERRSYARAGSQRAVRLTFAAGSLYATLIDFGRTTLARLHEGRTEDLLESTSPLYGPVESGGIVYAGTRGSLVALEGEGLRQLDSPLVIEDMRGLDQYGFAIAGGALVSLPVSAEPEEPLFIFDQLRPPADAAHPGCWAQWERFQLHLHSADHGVDAGAPTDAGEGGMADEPPDAEASSLRTANTCSSVALRSSDAAGTAAPWLSLCVAFGFRTARRRAARRSRALETTLAR